MKKEPVKKKKEKRDTVLYVRVTPTNKKWVVDRAKEVDLSESQFMNGILNSVREG